jgi:hypothetical protein
MKADSAHVEEDGALSERGRVVLHRYEEARLYGFTRVEALRYAESSADVGDLRRLKAAGCPPRVAADILL